jgi:predicted HD phosphohydrolase
MRVVDVLAGLVRVTSSETDGLTELDHALQCAFELRQARPDDFELQVAGLVHDVGHRFADDERHARAGAAWARPRLGDRVADLVEAHVLAKRYLVAVDPCYCLSTVSATTLVAQGGPLPADDRTRFEAAPWFADAVLLRRADDAAKVPGRSVPPLAAWLPVLERMGGGTVRSHG